MRLLDTRTGRFVEKDPRTEGFKYAILSHVWDANGEQTHQELKKIQEKYVGKWVFSWHSGSDGSLPMLSAIWKDHRLSPKILNACRVARKDGYRYIWIDSCCIDKTSSSELSEAINTMYAWYERAHVCYAYLADVPPRDALQVAFRRSRWFTRGWTLQELLAPKNLVFLSMDWARIGTKDELTKLVNTITGISTDVLLPKQRHPLHSFSVAQRLSWAARRKTTRVEDRAYSLLGIFSINMPTLYGEGEGAFQRLQEEILRRIPDPSIFAWDHVYLGPQILSFENLDPGSTPPRLGHDNPQQSFDVRITDPISMLSPSPDRSVNGQSIEVVPLPQLLHHYPHLPVPDYSFTPHGIRTQMPLIPLSAFLPDADTQYTRSKSDWYLAVLGCEHADRPGHLLGQVCCVESSSGVRLLSRGCILVYPIRGRRGLGTKVTVVALSPEALSRSSALARVVPVYLSHLSEVFQSMPSHNFLYRPHKAINLLLKRKNDAPRPPPSSGSGSFTARVDEPAMTTLSLRWPDQDNPNTHWLTISRSASQSTTDGAGQDTVTIKYTYALEDDGQRLSIVAHVTGTMRGHPVIPVQALLLTDETPWRRQNREPRRVALDNGNGSKAEVELSCEYLALNHYTIDAWFRDDVQSPCL